MHTTTCGFNSRKCKAVRSWWCARLILVRQEGGLFTNPLPSRVAAAPLGSGTAGASTPRAATLATCAAHKLRELRTIGGFDIRSLCFRRGTRNNLAGGPPARAARYRSVHLCNPPLILCTNNRSACMREERRVVMRVVGNLAESKHSTEASIAAKGKRVHFQQKVARFCAERSQCALLRRVFARVHIMDHIRQAVEAGWVVQAYELCLEECACGVGGVVRKTNVSKCMRQRGSCAAAQGIQAT